MIIDQISLDDLEARVRHGHLSFMSVAMEDSYTRQINSEIVKNAAVIFSWGLIAMCVFMSFDYFFVRDFFYSLVAIRVLTVGSVAGISMYALKNYDYARNHAENVVCFNIFASALQIFHWCILHRIK